MDAVAHTYDDGQDSCGDEEGHFDAGDNVTCVRHDGKKASMSMVIECSEARVLDDTLLCCILAYIHSVQQRPQARRRIHIG
jgi:hypothetical protein